MKLEDLPSAQVRDQVILMAAELDDDICWTGLLLYQVTGRPPQSSLLFYLERGLKEIANVSKKIANAKTEAEAVAADLQRKHILGAVEEAEKAILDLTQNWLRRGVVNMDDPGARGGFVAIGKRKLGGEFELVPAEHWELGIPDWLTMKLALPSDLWFAVRVIDVRDLSPEEAALITEPQSPPPQPGPDAGSSPDSKVSPAKLSAFLREFADGRPPGTNSVDAFWSAAREHFAPRHVTRARVIRWMKESLSPDERLGRGQKNQSWRFGEHKKKA